MRFRVGPGALAAASLALMVGSALVDRTGTAGTEALLPGAASTVDVVEGRYAVALPSRWTVTRVTGGPGSRRLQATSPDDPDVAVHVTGSYAPETTLAEAARILARAINGQPAGVFVDFRADGRVADRPAITYREVRPGRVVDWAVVLDGSTRISVGCQNPPGRQAAVRTACAAAVASARERGTGGGR